MGFRLETYSDNWYFKDSAYAKFGHPNIWYIVFFSLEIFIQIYGPQAPSPAILQ
jgi:hypothetical protein